jgi:putative DNA methylase
MRTELTANLEKSVSALASSIVLVCRPQPEEATITTRRDFVSILKEQLPRAFAMLQSGGIAPVDLAQAAIGPGMAAFSRYKKVLEPDGTPMTVRTALTLINQALDEHLTAQEGDLDLDTRFCVAWFEQFGHADAPFGTAETLCKAKNTSVDGLVEAGVVFARAGKVRLKRRDELDPNWSPATDLRLTVWECVQYVIITLNDKGAEATAKLMAELGSRAEEARLLAYRLYAICERKGWSEEGLAYNALAMSWQGLEEKAALVDVAGVQGRLQF